MNRRCVFDLKGYGRLFRRYLLDLGLSTVPREDVNFMVSDLDFAYNELTSQIVMSVGADMNRFLQELQTSPDYQLLAHIPRFQSHNLTPEFIQSFHPKFTEYALSLVSVIASNIGLQYDLDYLLEAVAEDYIIVMVTNRNYQHA